MIKNLLHGGSGRRISSPELAELTAFCMLCPLLTMMTPPWARVVPMIRLRKKVRMNGFMIEK